MAQHKRQNISLRKLVKRQDISIENPFICVLAVVIIFAIIWLLFVVGVFKLNATTANISTFNIGNAFDCKVNRDEIIHDDETDSDYFVAYFTAHYYGPEVNNQIEEQNTTGYDENTPTADQLSEEEQEQLSNEEIERINEKTINEYSKRLAKKRTAGEFVDVGATQNGRELEEPTNVVREGAGNDTNNSSLHKGAASGESYDFYIMYTLRNLDPVTVYFFPTSEDGEYDTVEIIFNISERFTFNMLGEKLAENFEISQKQSVKTIEFKAADINLVDGWYADSEAVSLVRLKNPKFGDATLDFNFSSSVNAQQLAQETAAWTSPAPEISQITINGRTYYYFSRDNNSFVICTNGKSNLPLRIMGSGLSLDDAMPLLKQLTF